MASCKLYSPRENRSRKGSLDDLEVATLLTSARYNRRMCRLIGPTVLPIALLGAQLISGQDSVRSNADVPDAATNLVRMHKAWGAGTSTPNASLTIKELSRSGRTIKFNLIAEGVAKDGIYSIVAWPVTQKQPVGVQQGVTLDATGLAICAGTPTTCRGDKPNDPIDLVLQPVPGEPVRIGLVSASGDIKVFAKIVPFPLRGEDRGCTIEGVLLTPGSELVLIEGSGFSANTELTMDSDSEGERHSQKSKADADGRYVIAILPYKQGVAGGNVKVDLKSAKCSPSVRIPWGRRN